MSGLDGLSFALGGSVFASFDGKGLTFAPFLDNLWFFLGWLEGRLLAGEGGSRGCAGDCAACADALG